MFRHRALSLSDFILDGHWNDDNIRSCRNNWKKSSLLHLKTFATFTFQMIVATDFSHYGSFHLQLRSHETQGSFIMTASSVKSHTQCSFWTFALLLLVSLQAATLLTYCGVVFIFSSEFLSSNEININFFKTLVILCFYVPVVLLAFALLATLLAAHAKDIAVLRFSMICQAASCLLTLVGYLHQSYMTWKDMTTWFYVPVFMQVQLILTTVLTRELAKMLTPHWE